jgi:hypothetical protein
MFAELLIQVVYKCITIRLEPLMNKIIHKAQTTFIKGRNIMNNTLALHEILHETKRKRKNGVVLKLDFEKAYDKVHWGFLLKCLNDRGFDDTWCQWIEKILYNGIVVVKINGHIGPYFQSHKGVRQGDSLSPLLFNVVVDCLSKMACLAQQNHLVTGLIPHLIPRGVAILQYADDTIMCLKDDPLGARNVKILLYLFEQMSGLKINFDKSEIIMVGGDNNLTLEYAEIFNCQVGFFPIKYLGVPISASRIQVAQWQNLEGKLIQKLDIWQGNARSIGGRTILINSSLSSTVTYHMSMFLLPKTTLKILDKIRRKFFWQGGSVKKKYHLVKWDKICKSKKNGGLGIKNLRKMNINLRLKWWWLLECEDELWQEIVRLKYVKQSPICLIPHRLDDSPLWKDLLKIRQIYLKGRTYKMNNGKNVSFWLNVWLEDTPMSLLSCAFLSQSKSRGLSI